MMLVESHDPGDFNALELPPGADLTAAEACAKATLDRGDPILYAVDPTYGAVAAAAICPLWRGVAECWFMPGAIFFHKSFGVLRLMRSRLHEDLRRGSLWRIQAHAAADHPAANRMLDWLGFVDEGVMTAFGPDGRDHVRWALLGKRS